MKHFILGFVVASLLSTAGYAYSAPRLFPTKCQPNIVRYDTRPIPLLDCMCYVKPGRGK